MWKPSLIALVLAAGCTNDGTSDQEALEAQIDVVEARCTSTTTGVVIDASLQATLPLGAALEIERDLSDYGTLTEYQVYTMYRCGDWNRTSMFEAQDDIDQGCDRTDDEQPATQLVTVHQELEAGSGEFPSTVSLTLFANVKDEPFGSVAMDSSAVDIDCTAP